MGPIETFHGWGGQDGDLQLHLDHVRIRDVDLPYYRIADVAVVEPEPDSSQLLPTLVIRLGEGEEFAVPLPADQAERARSLIQMPEARREALLQGAWTPAPAEPHDELQAPPPPPVPTSWLPWAQTRIRPGWKQRFLRRRAAPELPRRLSEWAFGAVLVVLAAVALVILVLPRSSPKSVPAANLSPTAAAGQGPSPAATAPRAERSVAPRHASPSPTRTKHSHAKHHKRRSHSAGPKGTGSRPVSNPAPVVAPQPVPSPPVPHPSTSAPHPPKPPPSPSISLSQPGPKPSISTG